jgi:hypothetical protein
MSLTYDALQKAAREKQSKTGVSPVPVQPATPVAPVAVGKPLLQTAGPATTNSLNTWIIFALAGLAIVAIAGAVFLFSRAKTAAPTPAPVAAPATAPASPVVAAPLPARESPAPPPPATVDSRFRVTGIMKDPEGKFAAVLNGRVVYESHYVDGATVKRIERDRVTLDVAGHEVVLRLF